jgi:hypothetical protein
LSDNPIDASLLVATKHNRGDEQKDAISGVHSNEKLAVLQADYFSTADAPRTLGGM